MPLVVTVMDVLSELRFFPVATIAGGEIALGDSSVMGSVVDIVAFFDSSCN